MIVSKFGISFLQESYFQVNGLRRGDVATHFRRKVKVQNESNSKACGCLGCLMLGWGVTLLGTIRYPLPLKALFENDNFPNLPLGGICIRSRQGNELTLS